MKKIILWFIFVFSVLNISLACDFVIENNKWYFTDWEINGEVVKPGDEICIQDGERWYLKFVDFHGTKDNPIVIKNDWWLVSIDTDHTYGLALSDSSFVYIRWDWESSYNYGIKVRAPKAWHVVSIGDWSTDIEISNIEIYGHNYDESYSALWVKTDPKCGSDFVRWKFEMKNISVHDNYIHDINQWFYFGWTFFTRVIDCGWYNIQWHLIQWVKIYNNTIERVGQDWLQVSSAISTNWKCEIYDNYLQDTSLRNLTNQKSAITIWWWSKCDVYDNTSINSNGPGVLFLGYEWKIYNNLIVNAGKNLDNIDWIFVDHRSGDDYINWSIEIFDNTILNPARNWIRFYNKYTINNIIENNLIVNPGFYAHENHWAWKENGQYIYLEKWRIDRNEINNWKDISNYLMVNDYNNLVNNLWLEYIDNFMLQKIKKSKTFWVQAYLSLLEDDWNWSYYNDQSDDYYVDAYNDNFLWWSLFDFYFPTREDVLLVEKVVKIINKEYLNKKINIKSSFKKALDDKKINLRLRWILAEIVESL